MAGGLTVDPNAALEFFVAVTVASLAATLMFTGRRRPESVMLAAFLALVAVNFFAVGMGRPDWEPRWGRVAYAALAWDPVLLLAFVTLYPYRRRPLRVVALLVAVAMAAVVSSAFLFLAPALTIVQFTSARVSDPGHVWIVGVLAVAYAAAWALAVKSAADAPTPRLAHRASWLVVATGVMVVPRLALVPEDLGLSIALAREVGSRAVIVAANGFVRSAIVAAALLAMLPIARRLGGEPGRDLRRAFAVVALVSATLIVVPMLVDAWRLLGNGPSLAGSILYGLRWLLVSGILVYGLLAYEVVEFRRAGERAMPALGAVVGAAAAFLVTAASLGNAPASTAIAAGVGLAAAVPAATLAQGGARRLARAPSSPTGWERRLVLYRAAVETAWAHGPPGPEARARLERDRRAFGLSFEEARTLEHLVASSMRPPPVALAAGDEPVVGIVLEAVIGEGASGRVFSARRHPRGDRVVVKELRAPAGDEGAAARERLLRELTALERIDHPNIVRLLDAHVTNERLLLVLEHVDGRSLRDVLGERLPREREVRAWITQVLDALESAHSRGVVHRDVKPENVLVDARGNARLVDFGVAATIPPASTPVETATTLGEPVHAAGTVAYMAPEQAQGGRADPRSDLYAVGLVALEALVGRPAFDFRGVPLADALARVRRPRHDLSDAPLAWRVFLSRALAADPAERFASAAEMRHALIGLPEGADGVEDPHYVMDDSPRAAARARSGPP